MFSYHNNFSFIKIMNLNHLAPFLLSVHCYIWALAMYCFQCSAKCKSKLPHKASCQVLISLFSTPVKPHIYSILNFSQPLSSSSRICRRQPELRVIYFIAFWVDLSLHGNYFRVTLFPSILIYYSASWWLNKTRFLLLSFGNIAHGSCGP